MLLAADPSALLLVIVVAVAAIGTCEAVMPVTPLDDAHPEVVNDPPGPFAQIGEVLAGISMSRILPATTPSTVADAVVVGR
jgi:hypothetical protein